MTRTRFAAGRPLMIRWPLTTGRRLMIGWGAAVLALAACGSAGTAGSVGTAGTVATSAALTAKTAATGAAKTVGSPAGTIPGCSTGVWAENFTDAGKLAWKVSLPVPAAADDGQPVQPLAIDGLSVFTDGNALYALRLSDGHPLWHKVFPNASNILSAGITGVVAGVWAWKGSVIAALGLDSGTPTLVSLNAATGAVRWRVKLDNQELNVGSPVITSDGVAAVLTLQDTVKTFDLSTGKQLWSRTYRKDARIEAEGDLLIVNAKPSDTSPTTLHSVVARTGHTLWTRSDFPNQFLDQPAPDGIVLGYGVDLIPPPPPKKQTIYPVMALSAATGKTLWTLSLGQQLTPGQQVTALWAAPAGVVVATGLAGTVLVKDPTARLYLADLKTGKVRWTAAGHTDPYTTPVITAANVITVATTPATGTVVDHGAAAGAVRWKAVITDVYGRYLAQPDGPDVLVAFPAASASKPSRLLAIDVATGATRATNLLPDTSTVGAPLTVTGGDALVEPETLSCAVPVAP